MIDTDSFLAELAENRRHAQSAARVGSAFVADSCDLPSALDLILPKGSLIQPQLARSPFASPEARVGVPSGERAQIEYWWSCFGEEANWLLDTAASGILAIEFSVSIPPYNLFRRAGEYRMFERTLRFKTPTGTFALLSVPPGRSMSRGWYSGVHWRTPVLIPPSRVLWGPDEHEFELSYLDPSAPLLPAFETLLGPPVRPF
jgi:hypothetical protein